MNFGRCVWQGRAVADLFRIFERRKRGRSRIAPRCSSGS
jgi:hypothetical protein